MTTAKSQLSMEVPQELPFYELAILLGDSPHTKEGLERL